MKRNAGQFQKGQHWRNKQPYWDREWLYREYIINGRSSSEIASQFDCKENNIHYFLHKHNIPIRNISQARAIKHWGVPGKDNPMYGRNGADNPNWRGGVTPDRQGFYVSKEWKSASRLIWKRDKGKCRRCGLKAKKRSAFHIHHIVSFQVIELRADVNNLVLLCQPCHSWVHSNENVNKEFVDEL